MSALAVAAGAGCGAGGLRLQPTATEATAKSAVVARSARLPWRSSWVNHAATDLVGPMGAFYMNNGNDTNDARRIRRSRAQEEWTIMRRTSSGTAWPTWVPLAALAALAATACGGGEGATKKADTFSLGNVHAISTTADVSSPYDAAPSASSNTIYFTASGAQGAAVYWAATSQGKASVLFAGAPLVFPSAIAVSDDDKTLFVSDPAAEQDTGPVGGIYAISLPKGSPRLISGSLRGSSRPGSRSRAASSTSRGRPPAARPDSTRRTPEGARSRQ